MTDENLPIKIPERPSAWLCPICLKVDFPDIKESLAFPEHVSYRGCDIGNCKGTMIPMYTEEAIVEVNNE